MSFTQDLLSRRKSMRFSLFFTGQLWQTIDQCNNVCGCKIQRLLNWHCMEMQTTKLAHCLTTRPVSQDLERNLSGFKYSRAIILTEDSSWKSATNYHLKFIKFMACLVTDFNVGHCAVLLIWFLFVRMTRGMIKGKVIILKTLNDIECLKRSDISDIPILKYKQTYWSGNKFGTHFLSSAKCVNKQPKTNFE